MKEIDKNIRNFKGSTPIWHCLPSNIMWQQYHRGNDNFDSWEIEVQDLLEGINISIILNSAILIEGYLEETLRKLYNNSINQIAPEIPLLSRISEKFAEDLNRSTFNSYDEMCELVTGSGIKEILGQENLELWADIKNLFRVRNVLAHSQSIEMIFEFDLKQNRTTNVIFLNKFKQIKQFLESRKLIPKNFSEDTKFVNMFFRDSVADFIFEKSKLFIITLDQKLKSIEGYNGNLNLNGIFRNIRKED